jgi:hypothetical protein
VGVVSAFARWGWLAAAVNVLFVLLNLACIVWFNGGPLNWAALVICSVSGVYTFHGWRQEVRSDAAHRAWLADFQARMERLRGDQ